MATRRTSKPAKRNGLGWQSLVGFALLLALGGLYYVALGRASAASHPDGGDATKATAAAVVAPEDILKDTAKPAAERAQQFVAAVLKAHRAVVFSKSYCPYSMKGKDIMRAHLAQVRVVELDQEPAQEFMSEIQDALQQKTGARTVPRIFVDGQCLGGADDVQALHGTGELAKMLLEKGLKESK